MTARQLLAELHAAGCVVTVEGDRLAIDGSLSDTQLAAILEHKPALIALLTAGASEPAAPAPVPAAPAGQDAEAAAVLASWAALEPSSVPSSLPPGLVVAGVAIATPEMQQWRALRDAATRDGRKFDVPQPKYWYPPGTR